ncbi:MAG: hypothetical protein ACI4KB_01690 [Oscillospiraceae bacterium]
MKRAELMQHVGKEVALTFDDGRELVGTLGYTAEFSEEYKFRRAKFFTIDNWDFRAGQVTKVQELGQRVSLLNKAAENAE